jgi:hypothetical protein
MVSASHLRLRLAIGWLLLAASLAFVTPRPPKPPRPRRPAGEVPAWKQVVWLVLFIALACVVGFIFKRG